MKTNTYSYISCLSFLSLVLVSAPAAHAFDSKGKTTGWGGATAEASQSTQMKGTVVRGNQDKEQELPTSNAPRKKPAPTSAKTRPNVLSPKSNGGGNRDELVMTYITPSDENFLDLAKILQESQGIDKIVEAVNETFDFPHIDVVFDMCGEANAAYDSSTRRIIMCYELVSGLAEAFNREGNLTDEELGKQIIATLVFTFFHELGHAAVDVFDLPITGNEEDAVDRFATLILLAGSEDGDADYDLADNAIGAFDLDTAESLEDLDFADEHLVDEQRWFTMACLMVGSNPDKYEYLVGENGLPEERAQNCPDEYKKISKSWDALLDKHLLKKT